ncbi:MAG: hemerythrin domain-containing protein [Myxococcota bacterium]
MESEPETPTAEEIRARIRAEHHGLAAELANIEALAARVPSEGRDAVVALRSALQSLGTSLHAHLQYEEYRLPALARDAVSSEELQEEMRQEHRAQRELLARVVEDLDETAVGEQLIVGVREVVRAIRDDMAYEENEILSKL